mmetsp:Transcript_3046/g.4181  ORF Transcript_3046/g.4181 Transcript_3046/m.4181 type:complete len:300 (+) Transcript_3046:137-1036(+)|eukprot:CAMPEP_0114343310 /NCGR_PEP_ID=MMETSP0101-20121206/10493_1 /TAXON_ID=38822 ORGANISM="Pteridomonas danica, Strain PT" /NCGR_SAMPLE_ID=MMETSP0101 /ASSEMBLY_ACC=CAM_ASM_000211 /LENGTH=299 /DNA_ID=CAMNT_0001477933 /DNA_START=141 /DNA_END=1040 /DNA_ORIENTATION=-
MTFQISSEHQQQPDYFSDFDLNEDLQDFSGCDASPLDLSGDLTFGEAASEIDSFSSLFLDPIPSNVSKKRVVSEEFEFALSKALFTTKSFGLTEGDLADPFLLEKLLPTTSSFSPSLSSSLPCPPTTSIPSGTNKLALSVPSIPTHNSVQVSQDSQYVARPMNSSGQYMISLPSSSSSSTTTTTHKPIKRKRNTCKDEDISYPTDGELFNVIVHGIQNFGIPNILEEEKSSEQQLLEKRNRLAARLKLRQKQASSKANKFNGHYPDRKKVASSRKRVGGRFVTENTSVFRPATQTAMGV